MSLYTPPIHKLRPRGFLTLCGKSLTYLNPWTDTDQGGKVPTCRACLTSTADICRKCDHTIPPGGVCFPCSNPPLEGDAR